MFKAVDDEGLMTSSCDCSKGTLSTACLHMQLVAEHEGEFGGPIYEGEEPSCFPLAPEQDLLIFSVASMSGSHRHHSHKRTIVAFAHGSWNCHSCIKERYISLVRS